MAEHLTGKSSPLARGFYMAAVLPSHKGLQTQTTDNTVCGSKISKLVMTDFERGPLYRMKQYQYLK